MKKVKVGIVGLGCRGSLLADLTAGMEEAQITAVCDVYEDRTASAADKIEKKCGKRPKEYLDFMKMLTDANVEAVIIATSWDEHIRMAIESMKAGKITAVEVGGAYDVEECRELVRTYEQTRTPFMFLENCCYGKFELLSTALVRAGKLGTIVHCHGAYGHDLRDEVLGGRVNRHYRLENYRHRNCENYPTHELGPIARLLGVNRGNQMLSLVSVASKAAGLEEFSYTDKNPDLSLRGEKFAQGDIVNTIITCAGGETISLKLDTTLPRYYSREFTVRGTKGLCLQDIDAVVLDGEENLHEFYDPEESVRKYLCNSVKFAEYLPKIWKNIGKEQLEAGHGGMDALMLSEFYNAILTGSPMPIDVYDAAAWMCITALSGESIARGGMPVSIPDFTCGKWITRKNKDVVPLG